MVSSAGWFMEVQLDCPSRVQVALCRPVRIFLDCTSTYHNPVGRTGIPRVVRNVVASAGQAADSLGLRWNSVLLNRENWQTVCWQLPHDVSCDDPLRRRVSGVARRVGRRLRKTFVPRTLVRWVGNQISRVMPARQKAAVDFGPGDVLLLLDGYWTYPSMDLAAIRRTGARIGMVVYDLTPIKYPQYHTAELTRCFVSRLREVIPHSDFFVSISRTVRDEVREYVQREFPERAFPDEAFGWFPLGVKLDMARTLARVRPGLHSVFCGGAPVYLCVGTVEPRKNHKAILDAFDQLWRQSPEVRLCLVGRHGWMADEIGMRIKRHARYGQQLFWFQELGDSELDYCYRRSKSLLYASFAEGFGLPIAESLQYGLPVIASDIPVHREVGGEFCAYFDPHRPEALAELVAGIEAGRGLPVTRRPEEYLATDWETSTRRLFEECLCSVKDGMFLAGQGDACPHPDAAIERRCL